MSESESVMCPACGKRYRWKAALAGRSVRCGCSAVLTMPTQPGAAMTLREASGPTASAGDTTTAVQTAMVDRATPAEDDGGYELDLPPEQEAAAAASAPQRGDAAGKCPKCNLTMSAGAVICLNCGYNVGAGKTITTELREPTDEALPGVTYSAGMLAAMGGTSETSKALARETAAMSNRGVDLYWPLGLLAGGVLFTILQFGFSADGLRDAMLSLGVQVFVMVPLLLIAIVIIAKALDVAFGPAHIAIFKLAAIAIGPLSFADWLVSFVMFGSIFAVFLIWSIYMVVCGPFIALMFDLDYNETAITVATVTAVRLVTVLFVIAAVISMS